jgi:hypothetical protein
MDARRGAMVFGAVCAFIATLLMIQLWLVTASLEALYSDQTGVLLPATLASAVLFLINGRLFVLVRDFDRRLRQASSEEGGQGR